MFWNRLMRTWTDNRHGAGHAGFSRKAWQQVRVEAPAELELYGKRNRGHLAVTLINDTGQTLEPGSDSDIVFSFRLLDHGGKASKLECVRTPLSRPVAPGARHSQIVTVIIPTAELKGVSAIRVGLLCEGEFWVERVNPKHPCTVQIVAAGKLSGPEATMAAAGQIWPRGKGNGFRWPYGSMMVSEQHKLLYIPVAKCACTSLKSMMVKLAGVDSPDIAIELGVHFVTDRFNTGVQLKDKPIDLAREILASDDYFKFSVIRDPFERLVSAYLEKFVYNRASRQNLAHTRKVIREVQGPGELDLDTGISFDRFVEYILRQDPYDLDPHWRPQYLYFQGIPHISRIFRLENIDKLERHLRQNLGIEVELGHSNATGKSDFFLPEASTLTAGEFDDKESVHPDSFLSSPQAEAIRRYYREDFEFYSAAG